jgi:hypothetical protein
MFGVEAPTAPPESRFRIYASTRLSHIDLQVIAGYERAAFEYERGGIIPISIQEVRLHASMQSYTRAIGSSYADCLARLMGVWEPPHGSPDDLLGSGQRQLPPGGPTERGTS